MDIDKLSEKEREELLSRLSAEKKLKEAAKRKNYQKMRSRFIASTEKRVRKYVKEGMALKKWLHDEANTFYNAMKGYGELKRDEQLGFTDYLNRWIQSKGEEERNPVYKLAMSLLQRNEAGDLDYKSISRLYELEQDFNDTEYTSIMQLFRESNIVEGTVVRFYFEEKDEMNRWKRIEPSFNQM